VIALAVTREQLGVVSARERNLFLAAGRRWGKTYTARARILTRCSTPGTKYWYIAPTYNQVWQEYLALARHPGLLREIESARETPHPIIRFRNGSEVHYRSFQRPQNLRGDGIAEFWVDEVQDIDESEFQAVLRPLISDCRGTLIMSGQFRGLNWYHDQFYLQGQKGASGYRSWRFPTSTGIRFQSEAGREELALVKASMPSAIYDQEFDCIPSHKTNAVFRAEDLAAATRGHGFERGQGRYLISCDIGRIVDPSALVAIDAAARHVAWCELRPLRERHEDTAKRLAQKARDFGARVMIDATGGGTGGSKPASEVLAIYRAACPGLIEWHWTAGNKEAVVNDLSVCLEQRRLTIAPSCHELLRQLAAYEYTYLPHANRYDYHGPDGHQDDLVAALAQGLQGALKGYATQGGAPVSAVM
jgi:hypothetical protein